MHNDHDDAPARVCAFLKLRCETPVPSLTSAETAQLLDLQRSYEKWSEVGSPFHPANRSKRKGALRDEMLRAKTPEDFARARQALAGFDSVADSAWRAARGNASQFIYRAVLEILRTAFAREIQPVAQHLAKLRAINLADVDLSTHVAVQRVERLLAELETSARRVEQYIHIGGDVTGGPVGLSRGLALARSATLTETEPVARVPDTTQAIGQASSIAA